jgi:hypothetical protein
MTALTELLLAGLARDNNSMDAEDARQSTGRENAINSKNQLQTATIVINTIVASVLCRLAGYYEEIIPFLLVVFLEPFQSQSSGSIKRPAAQPLHSKGYFAYFI